MKINTIYFTSKYEQSSNNKAAEILCFNIIYPYNEINNSISEISQKISQGLRSLRANIQNSVSNKNYVLLLTLFTFKEGKE
ncbi:MAG: hypothetical protein WCP65_01520 [Bacteroidota bacterium]